MQTRSPGRRALWLLGGIAVAGLGYAGARAASASPQTGSYRAETRWGEGEPGGVHRVEVDVSRRGRGTYVEYSVHMDPPGQTAGCRARAEQGRGGRLEFSCSDGWNDVRGSFHASRDSAVLQVDAVKPGGGGLGAFYGEHALRRVGAARGSP
jgi:hypothetical protein